MFLSPLGERLGEGVQYKAVSCITPSPSLSPKGGEEHDRNDHELFYYFFVMPHSTARPVLGTMPSMRSAR
jgi:hypothetical protein